MNNLSGIPPVTSITEPIKSVSIGTTHNVQLDWLKDILQGGPSNSLQPAISSSPGLTDSAPTLVQMLQIQSQIHAQVLRAELISKALESANSAMRRLSQNAA